MSREHLAQIIGRTITDTRFRTLFFGDVDKALAGHDLTDHEVELLRATSNCSVIRTSVSIAGFRYRQLEQSLDDE
jgi:hypothetical protein